MKAPTLSWRLYALILETAADKRAAFREAAVMKCLRNALPNRKNNHILKKVHLPHRNGDHRQRGLSGEGVYVHL